MADRITDFHMALVPGTLQSPAAKAPAKLQSEQNTMTNLLVTWDLPTTRDDSRPLPIEEIKHTLVEMMVDGAPDFTALDPVLPTETQEIIFSDIDPGTYHFNAYTVDTKDQFSLPASGSITIDPALPGSPQNFTLTLE